MFEIMGGGMKKPRATKRTEEVENRIIEGLSKGTPLAVVCREDGMPDVSTVWDWQQKDAEFAQSIARARELGFDAIALEALTIADTPVEGIEHTDTPEGPRIKRADMLGHRKLQVETRLKLLAKWDPKRYGERIAQEITGADGGPIQSASVTLPPDQESALQTMLADVKARVTKSP